MVKVTFSDMNNRIKTLSSINESMDKVLLESVYNTSKNGRYVDVYRCIESCARSNKDIPFNIYMELFDRVVETGNISNIVKTGDFIIENVIPKIRDGKKTQEYINRKMGRMKAKLKVKNSLEVNTPKQNTNQKPNDSIKKEEALLEIYQGMLTKAYVCENYDRIALNYNNISKRFNLESFFIDRQNQSTSDTIVELCSLIDTYTMSTSVKFSIVIESAWYGFESLRLNYNKKEVLESATDYFLFKENGYKCCKNVLDTTIFYDKNDKNIEIFMEDQPEYPADIDNSLSEDINKYINQYCSIQESTDEDKKKEKEENTRFNKIFNKFKKEELGEGDKPAAKLKSLVSKLYVKNVDGVINGTPKLLSWIRAFFILGSATVPVIGPALSAVAFISDRFIALHMERTETKKMLDCFNSEIKKTKEKIKTVEDNEEKDNLKKYLKSLEDGKNKIDSYYNDLLTQEEQDKRFEEEMNNDNDSTSDDDDGFLDDMNLDYDFMEFFIMNTMSNKISSFLECNEFVTPDSMYSLVNNIDDECITDIATLASLYPDEFYKERVREGIENHIQEINDGAITYESVVSKVLKKDAYVNALNILETVNSIDKPITVREADIYLDGILENTSVLNTLIRYTNQKNDNSILEASMLNTLRMATMKLKQNMTKLSDKEKNVSREIDRGANSLLKNVEKALTTGNRESVLRGTIIPSASKLVKLGLINAGLTAIGQPVLAVITTLGYIGGSHLLKNRERQLLIDELEVELKICQKYIDTAEANNDMAALKQCLTIQRNLQRQLQRVKYRMKIDLGRKHIDSSYLDNVDNIGKD